MPAGRRDTLIQFQRAETEQDEYGEDVCTWSSLGSEWASIIWGRGDERRQAAQESASQAATFQVLDNSVTRALLVTDRIVSDGDWDITGIAYPIRGEIELTAVRAA